MIYIPKHFKIHELVDKQTYDKFGKLAFHFFRPEALRALDNLREVIGRPLIINNWKDGGEYEWSGLRTIDYYGGAKWSAHRLGAAFDVKCKTVNAATIQGLIRANHHKLMDIRRMEIGTPTWTHIDVINTSYNYLYEFKPNE